MTFNDIPAGSEIFVDANAFIYHFAGDALYDARCTKLVSRIEQGELNAFTSADVLSDVAHRLMTIEPIQKFGWPIAGIASRLRSRYANIASLTVFRLAIESVPAMGVNVVDITAERVVSATGLSQTHGLLSGDALIVAPMQFANLSRLASSDSDFDRVPWIRRFNPA
jgi:predicted nucleic acid-binding protein